MNPQERERLVDSLLDRALGPRLVEPRSGLEERILANLPKEVERRPWWRWMWVPALAAAGVLALVIGMKVTQQETPAPVVSKKTVEMPKQEVAIKPEVAVPNETVPRREVATKTAPRHTSVKPSVEVASAPPWQELPRQAVFPATLPLTEQERLLLALVNRQGPQAELIAAEQQSEREKAQRYFETGEAPVATPTPAQPMR